MVLGELLAEQEQSGVLELMTPAQDADCCYTEIHFWTSGHKQGTLATGPRVRTGTVVVSVSDGVEHMATVGERAGLVTAAGQVGAESDGSKERGRKRTGMEVPRVFSTEGVSPFDQIEWDFRTAEIKDERGRAIFQQTDCEIPRGWSQLATNVVASKYFYGDVASGNGCPSEGKREYSVRQLIDRVTRTIADWGRDDGYFATAEDAERFYDELTSLCLNQYGSFNSPVWFNVGLYHRYGIAGPANNWRWDEETRTIVRATSAYQTPQASACFIQSVNDDMESIMRLAHSEAMLFKFGSGTGTDLSTLRSSQEKLSGGGRPSGPVSFMRVYDAIASVVKSGGKTRRAAKMQTLKCWHPDILEFIECKTKEEAKAQALIRQGYEANFNGDAYSSVMFQNANLSVRCSDAFLRGRERPGMDHSSGHDRPPHADLQGQDAARQDRPGNLAVRRPRRYSTRTRSSAGTPAPTPRRSTLPTRAASTCSSTTRPATSRR